MKILYIITQADGGGAQKYTLALAAHFGGCIAAGNEATKLFVDAKALGVRCIELRHLKRDINPWHDFLAMWEIRQLIKAEAPDIIHLNSTKAGILGSFAAIGLKKKTVFTAHGFVFNEPLPAATLAFYLALEKTASSYRDFIITVSDADRNSALQNNLIAANKIQTIHNGISTINFLPKEQARQALGLSDVKNKKIIGAIANGYGSKGIDVLEKASSLMTSESLTIVKGDNPKKVTNDGKFKVDGYVSGISASLKAFDIIAIPSRKEGLPFVLLEAMQAGLPIVATSVGGIPEALGDAGLLVPPENPQALAAALDKLVMDQPLADTLSQKALGRSQLFTEAKMLEEIKKVYEHLLK
jgi:glycosyltransferase involved in cell wall biosynthesis